MNRFHIKKKKKKYIYESFSNRKSLMKKKKKIPLYFYSHIKSNVQIDLICSSDHDENGFSVFTEAAHFTIFIWKHEATKEKDQEK